MSILNMALLFGSPTRRSSKGLAFELAAWTLEFVEATRLRTRIEGHVCPWEATG